MTARSGLRTAEAIKDRAKPRMSADEASVTLALWHLFEMGALRLQDGALVLGWQWWPGNRVTGRSGTPTSRLAGLGLPVELRRFWVAFCLALGHEHPPAEGFLCAGVVHALRTLEGAGYTFTIGGAP